MYDEYTNTHTESVFCNNVFLTYVKYVLYICMSAKYV